MRNPYRRAQSFRSLPKYRAVDSWRLYTAGLTRLNTNPTTTGRQIRRLGLSRERLDL